MAEAAAAAAVSAARTEAEQAAGRAAQDVAAQRAALERDLKAQAGCVAELQACRTLLHAVHIFLGPWSAFRPSYKALFCQKAPPPS